MVGKGKAFPTMGTRCQVVVMANWSDNIEAIARAICARMLAHDGTLSGANGDEAWRNAYFIRFRYSKAAVPIFVRHRTGTPAKASNSNGVPRK